MRRNSQLMLVGENVMLLPYKSHMVSKYHEWMKSPELLKLTASEPLSLQEEFEMQRKWLEDEDKCTFIIIDFDLFRDTRDEIGSMIGDTNLFFMANDDNDLCTAEVEIMIAECSARRKKRGWEAMILMLLYGISELKVQKYQAKIGMDNPASIKMFTKLGFKEESISDIFQEVTMLKIVDDDWSNWLQEQTKYKKSPYDHD